MTYRHITLRSTLLLSSLIFLIATDCQASPIVTKTDKAIIVDVSPFFRMNLSREPTGTLLDIDVLSGLVKVGYDRLKGKSPNVDVQVLGLGSTRDRSKPPLKPEDIPDDESVTYV